MLEGSVLMAGHKEFVSKKGNVCRLAKFVDPDNGEFAEVFMSERCNIPAGVKLLSPVKVKIAWNQVGGRTSFEVIGIDLGG